MSRTAKKKPKGGAKPKAGAKPKRRPPAAIERIGTPCAIEFRRDHDGKTYLHQFRASCVLYRSRDGRRLIIAPVQVSSSGVIRD